MLIAYVHACSEYLLGRLYANVLLAALDGRQRARKRLASPNDRFDRHQSISMKSISRHTFSTNALHVPITDPRWPHEPIVPAPEVVSKMPTIVSVTTEVQVADDHEYGSDKSMVSGPPSIILIIQ